MKLILILLPTLLFVGCGGGGDGGGGSTSPTPVFPTGMIGGSSHVTLHGLSTMRSAGTYKAQGSANIIGLIPNTCADPKPTMWEFPCEQGQVILTKTQTGWLEDHQLPAHVVSYNARLEFSDENGISVDHEGCTYSVGGVRTTIARHPTSLQTVSFERTCPGRGTESYSATVQEVVVGNSSRGERLSIYTLSKGGVKYMTINFLSGIDGGKFFATAATYAYFDASGAYTKTLLYRTVTPQ